MFLSSNPQLNKNGELHHLLSIEGLPAGILWQILDTAQSFVGVTQREVKKVPLLRGKAIFNLFFEPSTRTRTTFEIAAKRLSADVINLAVDLSSQSKGESVLDTVANLAAMQADMFIVRHSQSGAPYLIARHVGEDIHVINAGDGRHAHPTQGLLDVFTIRHYKKDFRTLRVAITCAVVDSGDQLVAFARMDGADLVSVGLARDKAFSALLNRMPTRDLAPLVQPGEEFYGYDSLAGGRMVVFAGGMPLERGGVLVGAIGVSGGSSEEDQRAVDAAVAAFDQRL